MIEIAFSVLITIIFLVAYVSQIRVLNEAIINGVVIKLDGISVPFWVSLNLALWSTLYNFIITDSHMVVIIPQGVNAVVGLFVLFMVLENKGVTSFRKRYALLLIVSSTLLLSLISVDLSQLVASGLVLYAYLSQISHIVRTKNVDGLSIRLFSFIALALILMITNILLTGSYSLANVTETFNLILILIIIGLVFKYRDSYEEIM